MTDRATPAATSNPPSISAPELHQILLDAHTRGNAARLRFIEVLGAVDRQRAYLELGFPDVVSYASATFGHGRSQIYDFLRVARALEGLPLIRESFERGKLSWTLTAAMTRVATAESEAEWIELARENVARRSRALCERGEGHRRGQGRCQEEAHEAEEGSSRPPRPLPQTLLRVHRPRPCHRRAGPRQGCRGDGEIPRR